MEMNTHLADYASYDLCMHTSVKEIKHSAISVAFGQEEDD